MKTNRRDQRLGLSSKDKNSMALPHSSANAFAGRVEIQGFGFHKPTVAGSNPVSGFARVAQR
jgi:hypothetical protein